MIRPVLFSLFQIAHGRRASVALPSAANASIGDGDSAAAEKPLPQQSPYPNQPQSYANQPQPPMMGAGGGGVMANDPNAAIIDQLNAEIAALRVEYTRGGGTRPDILRTIQVCVSSDVWAGQGRAGQSYSAKKRAIISITIRILTRSNAICDFSSVFVS